MVDLQCLFVKNIIFIFKTIVLQAHTYQCLWFYRVHKVTSSDLPFKFCFLFPNCSLHTIRIDSFNLKYGVTGRTAD